MADNEVKIVITGHDASGSKTLRGVREEADRASHSFGGLKTAVGLASGALAGLSVGAGLAGAVKSAAALEQAVANISTIKPELNTSAVFASLNEMQRRVPQSASQLASSLYDIFSSMDVGQDAALRLVETFAKGATAASTDAQTFGTAIMGVMNAYGASVGDAAHISDVFFNTVNRGVVTGQELASSLGPVTQSAKAAGVSIDELGALIAGVTKEGGPAAQNINNLNNFLAKVSTKEAREEIAKLGVATTDAAGNFRPIVDVLADLKPRLERMTEAQRANALQTIFPDAQARQGAMTLISQLDAVKDALKANQDSTGSTASAYAKMSATMNAQMTILKNTVMSVLTEIGAKVLPLLTPLISGLAQRLPEAMALVGSAFERIQPHLQGVGRALAEAFREDLLPKLQVMAAFFQDRILPAVQSLAEAISSRLAPVFERIGSFIAENKEIWGGVAVAIGGALVAAFAALAVAAGSAAVSVIAATAPIIAIGAAIAAAAAGVIWLVKNWDDLTARYPLLGKAAEAVAGALSKTWAFIQDEVGAFVGWWTGIWPSVQEAAVNVWNAVRTVAETITGALVAFWRAAGDDIMAIVGAFADYIKTTWDNIKTIVSNAIELIVNLINGNWSGAWENAKAIVGAFVRQVLAYVVELPAQVAPHLLSLAKKFLSWIADDVVPFLAGALADITVGIGKWLVQDAIPWAGKELAKLGKAIIDAIRDGISAAWDGFTGWFNGLLDRLLDGAKDRVKSFFNSLNPFGKTAASGGSGSEDEANGESQNQNQNQRENRSAGGSPSAGGTSSQTRDSWAAAEETTNSDDGSGVKVAHTRNAGGIAGLGHSTFSDSSGWIAHGWTTTGAARAAGIAIANSFADNLKAALGFSDWFPEEQFNAWKAIMQAEAGRMAGTFAAGQAALAGTGGGGLSAGEIAAGMSDSQFEEFVASLEPHLREQVRQERARAQEQQAASAEKQRTAAQDQQAAASQNRESAQQNSESTEAFAASVTEFGDIVQEARDAGAEAPPLPDPPPEDDEEERERRRRRRREEENRDNTAPGNAPGVPAHSGGGIIDEFAYLVNAAGRTIGTMSESAPEAIMPMPLLRGAMAALTPLSAPGPSAMQSPVGGEGVAVQIGHAVAAALAGMTVEMDGQTVGRLVSPYVSREIARDALLAGVNR